MISRYKKRGKEELKFEDIEKNKGKWGSSLDFVDLKARLLKRRRQCPPSSLVHTPHLQRK
jgi:hypothetical protein